MLEGPMTYYAEILSEIYKTLLDLDHLLSVSVLNASARKKLRELSVQIRLLAARAEEDGI
jgi:hypothetical protein